MDTAINSQENQPTPAVEALAQWRERIFFAIFLSCLFFAFIPYVQSALNSFNHQNWTLLFIHSISYLSIVVIVLFRRIPFSIRAPIALFTFYGVGLTALLMIGPVSSGRVWLFSFSIIATLLLGLRAGLASIIINALTLFAVGYFLSNGTLNWTAENSIHLKLWTVIAVTFIFLNSVVTISLAVLVRALEKDLVRSQYFSAKLQKANKALKESHEKRELLEDKLIQAQKMESVGRLAGGVAHDYNNISSIIIGYSELALEKVEPSNPLHDDLIEIFNAAKRSTDITRQLLAFARQQTIAPKVLDLNNTTESMLKMLRRLIGEDIDLAWLPGSEVWPVKMDPTQIDQILANLCVNARDAIADVGKVTIETENISFDENYCADHAGFIPGEYVLLAVSDDGIGMAPETLDKVFEPFFTTKGQGKGTGLGLATVYGIVKQNEGFINVYSEPDKGTSIKIYMPRHTGQGAESFAEENIEIPLSQGSEVVLLVEDDASILKLVERVLENLGYMVLPTNSPEEAIKLVEEHIGNIHLLITDVVMPEMNGRELSEKLQVLYPQLKILFMSGYTANVIAHRGVLDEGISFISKPFSSKEIALKIREVLDVE